MTLTPAPPTLIHEIQGAGHLSPLSGQAVANVPGIVTARRSNGFYMQDPAPDADDATSEGIFVFTSVGAGRRASATRSGRRHGHRVPPRRQRRRTNLTITEIVASNAIVRSSRAATRCRRRS